MTNWNDTIIAEFRENNGTTSHFGDNLVIIHSLGAKSGDERLNPVMGIPRGDGWLVIASAAGSPKHPAWYHNLKQHPDVEIEAVVEGNATTLGVTATEVDDAGYDDAWANFASRGSFEEYKKTTEGRRMPIFELTPR